jgi:hypothetical protein
MFRAFLIRTFQPLSLALTVRRIHSDIDCFPAFAACSKAFKFSAVKRTGTMWPFASPFGSLGRPTLLGFRCGIGFRLLNDGSAHRR